MIYSLTRTRENASQDSAGTYDLDGVPTLDSTPKYLTVQKGIELASGGVAEGKDGLFMIQRLDSSAAYDWAVIVARYLSGQLVRQSTRYSSASNGTDDVDFSPSDDLVVYGVNDADAVNDHETRLVSIESYEKTLQSAMYRASGDWGTLTVDHNTTTLASGTANYATITPVSGSSVLQITGTLGLMVERDGTSGSSYSGIAQLHYKDSIGDDIAFGDAIQVGPVSLPTSDTNAQAPQSCSFISELTQSDLNDSDEWEIKPFIAALTTGTNITVLDCSIRFVEILRP